MKNRGNTKRYLAKWFFICPTLAGVEAKSIGQNNLTDEPVVQKYYAKNQNFARANEEFGFLG
jgi:hypothetical protein